jgi:DNA-binding NarL/FixJ family response regulator
MAAPAPLPQTSPTAIAQVEVSLGEIRILLLGLHGLLDDVIRQLLDAAPELSVAAESTDLAELQALMARTGAEVVVCGLDEATTAAVSARVLDPHARVKVIGIHDDGRRAVLWELRPGRREIGDLSVPVLVEAIKPEVRWRTPAPGAGGSA